MVTLVLYGLLAVVLAGALFLLAAFLLPAGEQIAPPIRDEPVWDLPAGRRMAAEDVVDVRLPVALRGYRFAETDRLLDRLAEELQARDAELARLRGGEDEREDDDAELPQPRGGLDEREEQWQHPVEPVQTPAPPLPADRVVDSQAADER